MKNRHRSSHGGLRLWACLLAALCGWASTGVAEDFATIEPASSTSGYLARLLINEVPFPGEHGYESVADTEAAMLSILWVLHGRMKHVPAGYTQMQIASTRSQNIIDLITAKNQCEGFSMGADGKPTFASRVEERLTYLTKIANSGGAPGKFAGLLNYGQGLASAYMKDGIQGADNLQVWRQ